MNVEYVPYKNIDKRKWDNCINDAVNSLLYAHSFYLDNMAANWDALILNDYDAVMPLTWKKKWGTRYLYQPAFIQQGGIFFKKKLPEHQLQSFIKEASRQFSFAEITLNFLNTEEELNSGFKIVLRDNYILNLNLTYEALYENYLPAFTKSLRRIKKFDFTYSISDDYTAHLKLYKNLYHSRLHYFSDRDFSQFKLICKKLHAENKLVIRFIKNTDEKLLASVILLKDKKRLYNIISSITEDGKKLEANYFLYDRIIHEFSNTSFLLDFEGSDVKGIADFYKKINPENQPYPYIQFNNLPAIYKLFK